MKFCTSPNSAALFATTTLLTLLSAPLALGQNSGSNSAIAAGVGNVIVAGSRNAFIGAGNANVIAGANNFNSVVIGGINNSNLAGRAVIVGGRDNTIGFNSRSSTIAGGEANSIFANTTTNQSLSATIAGGQANVIGGDALGATISGGANNTSQAAFAIVGGGSGNRALAKFTGIAAGQGNVVTNLSTGSVIGGGISNSITATEFFEVNELDQIIATNPAVATIAGGGANTVSGALGFIGGGAFNTNGGFFAVIGGGEANTVNAYDTNTQTSGDYSVISGGSGHLASSYYSVISGGAANIVNGDLGAVSGGASNIAGARAAVPGGSENHAAGLNSFAAGVRAKAMHDYSFVWGGSPTVDTVSTNPMSYTARAPGGFRLLTSTNDVAGLVLPANSSTWASLSDSNAKTGIRPVDYRNILAKVAALPVTEWRYKHDPTRRYIGPMAQDFHATFGLGSDDKTISTLDTDGVTLAAIKGLVEEIEVQDQVLAERDAQIHRLEDSLRQVREQLSRPGTATSF
jgi:hypothetical protein